jgi:hypothetical protein
MEEASEEVESSLTVDEEQTNDETLELEQDLETE